MSILNSDLLWTWVTSKVLFDSDNVFKSYRSNSQTERQTKRLHSIASPA